MSIVDDIDKLKASWGNLSALSKIVIVAGVFMQAVSLLSMIEDTIIKLKGFAFNLVVFYRNITAPINDLLFLEDLPRLSIDILIFWNIFILIFIKTLNKIYYFLDTTNKLIFTFLYLSTNVLILESIRIVKTRFEQLEIYFALIVLFIFIAFIIYIHYFIFKSLKKEFIRTAYFTNIIITFMTVLALVLFSEGLNA